MDQPSEAVAGEGNAEQQIGDETNETTATDNGNGKVEELSLNQTEDTIYVPSNKRKVLNLAPPEEVPKNFADYLSDSEADESLVKTPIPTSVITSVPKPESSALEEASVENPPIVLNPKSLEESVPGPVEDSVTGESSVTPPADAISSAEPEQEESQPAQPEQILNLQPPSEELPAELLDTEQQQEEQAEEEEQAFTVADLIEEAENTKEEEPATKLNPNKETSTNSVEPTEEVDNSESEESPMEEEPVAQNPKAKKSQAVKAAELEQDWDEEGDNLEETVKKTPKPVASKSEPKGKMETEFTPRKSSRAPKPTEKKLESENQKNLNTDEMEESVDAIAKELEKSDSEVKKSGKKEKSPKKGKKQQQTGENKEDWVTLIFGENGEKVTEKGTPKSKQAKPEENKTEEEEMGPEAEEFLMDQTPFFSSKNKGAKKGGRPRKKDLDEKMDGVAKLGSNMYFYTGPGGADSPPSLHSDDEDFPVKKKEQEVEGARKSGRAGKGRNPRLEREDEVVDIPQVKAPPKPNLNPSWLKNHDGKAASTPVASKSKPVTSTPAPAKAVSTPVPAKAASTPASVKAATTPAAKPAVADVTPATPVAAETPPARGRSVAKSTGRANRASTESLDRTESGASPPRDEALPEFDPAKFTPGYVPKTVSKGEDEYMIVVSGVKDTGLCGGYWGNTETLGSRRRSKPVEALQIGKTEKTASRRGSVGSVGSSVDTTPSNKKTPQTKKLVAGTPQTKSNKKQVTKPEKSLEAMESSQSESEADSEQNTSKAGRGRKRKNEDTPVVSQEKKAKTSKKESVKASKEEQDEEDLKASFSDYDSGANETQPLRTTKRPSAKTAPDSPAKEAPLTSKQQTAVSAALAAGVPAGQQRSVSCVADTSTQREVVVECFAPYDDHRWVNIGKERDGMAPDAVQYARALRPPYHLLSFLRIKGHSTKGMSCTDKNTMVFVVLEGEITVILHTTQFNAKKGDSFYIPPKNYYNLINQKAREAELSLIQFQYDGPLPTVQPNSG